MKLPNLNFDCTIDLQHESINYSLRWVMWMKSEDLLDRCPRIHRDWNRGGDILAKAKCSPPAARQRSALVQHQCERAQQRPDRFAKNVTVEAGLSVLRVKQRARPAGGCEDWMDRCLCALTMRPPPHLTWNCNAIPVPDSCRHLLNKAEERLLMPVVPYHRNRVRHKFFCLVPHCSEKHYVHALVLANNAMPVPGSPFRRHDDPVPLA